jgi:hypothetical protein
MSAPLKKLTIKMFAPGNRTHKTVILAAGKGKVFKPGGEFDVLSNVADSLETQFPNDEFRMVQVGPAAFNFVWDRKKTLEEVADRVMIGGMHLGEVSTIQLGKCDVYADGQKVGTAEAVEVGSA